MVEKEGERMSIIEYECPRCHMKMQQLKYDRFTVVSDTCEIPLKLPSLNDYIRACRRSKFEGAQMKKQIEEDIMWHIKKLPRYDKPVVIHFHWVEGNKKRDLDNVCFAKKFILDALVKAGKLKDDNRKCVTNFHDTFGYEKGVWKVILEIMKDEQE